MLVHPANAYQLFPVRGYIHSNVGVPFQDTGTGERNNIRALDSHRWGRSAVSKHPDNTTMGNPQNGHE